jgi:2-oxoisovalerate dehydrogenase E1 component
MTEPNLVDFYKQMALIRQFEQRTLELSREGFIDGSIHLCAGQEAVPVGIASVLGPEDRVISTYRGHGWALACGVPVTDLLGEVCMREGGINGGRTGSALINAPDYRFLGENSIVGAGTPIAAGVALAAQRLGTSGVAVVTIGDGAMNQGNVHEAMVFAAAYDLPLVIVCENNGWAEMTPTSTVTRGADLIDRAAGYHISSRIVDGCDPMAVQEAGRWAMAEAREGRGPVFLECKTVRMWGHYNKDIEHYRPQADSEEAASQDPLVQARRKLIDIELHESSDLDQVDHAITRVIDEATREVRAMSEPNPATVGEHVVDTVVSGRPRTLPADLGEATQLTYQRAINRAMSTELETRPEVVVYGEDVGAAGGIFGVTRGLQKRFGSDRVFDTPIAESAIIGSAVGAAMQGMRPIVEIMWGDFLLVALDQLVNQAANVRYTSRGKLTAPMVLRFQQGATPGSCAQHSQNLEAILAHVPGLKVGVPSTPADAYAMTRAAVADNDPCVLVEARELYQSSGEVYLDAPPEAVGGATFHGSGTDAVVITWGPMVHRALEAAAQLAAAGIEISVLDLRWLAPLDEDAIAEAVERSGGRILVAHEANITGGYGAEIASRISEQHFLKLAQPVRRLGTADMRIPAARALQEAVIPGARAIEHAVASMLKLSLTR